MQVPNFSQQNIEVRWQRCSLRSFQQARAGSWAVGRRCSPRRSPSGLCKSRSNPRLQLASLQTSGRRRRDSRPLLACWKGVEPFMSCMKHKRNQDTFEDLECVQVRLWRVEKACADDTRFILEEFASLCLVHYFDLEVALAALRRP